MAVMPIERPSEVLPSPSPAYQPQDPWLRLHDDLFRTGLARPTAAARRAMAQAYRRHAAQYPADAGLALAEARRCEREAAAWAEAAAC